MDQDYMRLGPKKMDELNTQNSMMAVGKFVHNTIGHKAEYTQLSIINRQSSILPMKWHKI